MKKRKKGRTLSRVKEQRIALMRTLSVSLIKYKRIKTTLAKAKELRPFIEKLLTKAKYLGDKKKSLATVRSLKRDLGEMDIKELALIADASKKRDGGYTRIVKIGPRKSDSAEMALIEWVDKLKDSSVEVKEDLPKKDEVMKIAEKKKPKKEVNSKKGKLKK